MRRAAYLFLSGVLMFIACAIMAYLYCEGFFEPALEQLREWMR